MSMNCPPTFSPDDNGMARLIAGAPVAEMVCRMSAMDWKPCRSMSSRLMVSTGAALSMSTWRMRLPVTSIRSSVVGSCVLSWAAAAQVYIAVAASATRMASRSGLCCNVMGRLRDGWKAPALRRRASVSITSS